MNETTAKLLEQLAAKLGTTSEYLWGVLLKQAPISATITLFQTLGVVIFGIALWRIHVRLMKKNKEDRYAECGYEKYDMGAVIPMVVGFIVFAILVVACLCSVESVANGYFNPEYWALKEILSSLK
jgi:hypothetical protein